MAAVIFPIVVSNYRAYDISHLSPSAQHVMLWIYGVILLFYIFGLTIPCVVVWALYRTPRK